MTTNTENDNANRKGFALLNKWAFWPAAIGLLILLLIGFISPDGLTNGAGVVMSFILDHFSWLLHLGSFLFVILCVYVAFSKYGSIRLGGSDAKPDMSMFSWFSISLTACIGIAMIFYGAYEPLNFFMDPPGFLGLEPGSADAAESWGYVLLHWTLPPYAIWTVAGLVCVFICQNGKRKYKVSSSLYPLLGDKVDGKLGDVIDSFCIFALIGGLATSMGVATMQICGGLNYIFGLEEGNLSYILICAIVAVFFIGAASSGLHKGIKYVSTANVYIFIALLALVFILGNGKYQLNSTLTGLGYYLRNFLWESLYLEPAHQTGWLGNWSTFFFCWDIAPAPIMGLFLVKLAKGRTMRQFILVNMLCPCLFILVWFGLFGGQSIFMQLTGIDLFSKISEFGAQATLFILGDSLPGTWIFYILGLLACLFSLVTCLEAQTLAIADSCMIGAKEQSSPTVLRVFWGGILAGLGLILLLNGGYSGVQTAAVACGGPAVILMLIQCIAFIKSLIQREKYDLTLTDDEKAALIAEKENSFK